MVSNNGADTLGSVSVGVASEGVATTAVAKAARSSRSCRRTSVVMTSPAGHHVERPTSPLVAPQQQGRAHVAKKRALARVGRTAIGRLSQCDDQKKSHNVLVDA